MIGNKMSKTFTDVAVFLHAVGQNNPSIPQKQNLNRLNCIKS